MKRKAISTRTRFEVFKRDGFRCMYCGRTPPTVLLHVDHIIAVSNGGSNCKAERDRIKRDAAEVIAMLDHFYTRPAKPDQLRSVERFVERLPSGEVVAAMDSALAKKRYSQSETFRYFCGICWAKIKGKRHD